MRTTSLEPSPAPNLGTDLDPDLKPKNLCAGSLGTKAGSLLDYLDGTASPAGRRLLRAWLCRPLYRWGSGICLHAATTMAPLLHP